MLDTAHSVYSELCMSQSSVNPRVWRVLSIAGGKCGFRETSNVVVILHGWCVTRRVLFRRAVVAGAHDSPIDCVIMYMCVDAGSCADHCGNVVYDVVVRVVTAVCVLCV